jgi:hypothetical protein
LGLDTEVGACVQAARPRPGRRAALAVDSKALRGTPHASADGQAVHLLAVLDHRACAVLGQVDVDGKTNEFTQFAPLLDPLDLTGDMVTAQLPPVNYARNATRPLATLGLIPV